PSWCCRPLRCSRVTFPPVVLHALCRWKRFDLNDDYRGPKRAALVVMLAVSALGAADLSPRFALVQPELFSANGGQANAWADFDNDGDLDEFVGFRGRPNRLYK